MDHLFPQQLFPSFYNTGPPESVQKHNVGGWGSYDRVRPQVGPTWIGLRDRLWLNTEERKRQIATVFVIKLRGDFIIYLYLFMC